MGHKVETLKQTAEPNEIKKHLLNECPECQASFKKSIILIDYKGNNSQNMDLQRDELILKRIGEVCLYQDGFWKKKISQCYEPV